MGSDKKSGGKASNGSGNGNGNGNGSSSSSVPSKGTKSTKVASKGSTSKVSSKSPTDDDLTNDVSIGNGAARSGKSDKQRKRKVSASKSSHRSLFVTLTLPQRLDPPSDDNKIVEITSAQIKLSGKGKTKLIIQRKKSVESTSTIKESENLISMEKKEINVQDNAEKDDNVRDQKDDTTGKGLKDKKDKTQTSPVSVDELDSEKTSSEATISNSVTPVKVNPSLSNDSPGFALVSPSFRKSSTSSAPNSIRATSISASKSTPSSRTLFPFRTPPSATASSMAFNYPSTVKRRIDFLNLLNLHQKDPISILASEEDFFRKVEIFCKYWGNDIPIPPRIVPIESLRISSYSMFLAILKLGGLEEICMKPPLAREILNQLGVSSIFAQRVLPEIKRVYAMYLYPLEQVLFMGKEPCSVFYPSHLVTSLSKKRVVEESPRIFSSFGKKPRVVTSVTAASPAVDNARFDAIGKSGVYRRSIDTVGGYDLGRLLQPLSENFRWKKEFFGKLSMVSMVRSFESRLVSEANQAINNLLVLSADPKLVLPLRLHPKLLDHLVELYDESRSFIHSQASCLDDRNSMMHYLGSEFELELKNPKLLFYERMIVRERLMAEIFNYDTRGKDKHCIATQRIQYHRERMIAISIIIGNISFDDVNRTYLFERKDIIGWISGVLEDSVSGSYKADNTFCLQVFRNAFICLSNISGLPFSLEGASFVRQVISFCGEMIKGNGEKMSKMFYHVGFSVQKNGGIGGRTSGPASTGIFVRPLCESLPWTTFLALETLTKIASYEENLCGLPVTRQVTGSLHLILSELSIFLKVFLACSAKYIPRDRHDDPSQWIYLPAKDRMYLELILNLLYALFQQESTLKIFFLWHGKNELCANLARFVKWMITYMYPYAGKNGKMMQQEASSSNAGYKDDSGTPKFDISHPETVIDVWSNRAPSIAAPFNTKNRLVVPPIYPNLIKGLRIFQSLFQFSVKTRENFDNMIEEEGQVKGTNNVDDDSNELDELDDLDDLDEFRLNFKISKWLSFMQSKGFWLEFWITLAIPSGDENSLAIVTNITNSLISLD